MISMDEVIKEVALKNGHGLERDDPLLFLVTVMNCIARGYDDQNNGLVAKYAEILKEYSESHQVAAHQWRKDAKDYATAVLNASLSASREASAKILADGTAKAVAMVKEELGREMAEYLAAERREFQTMRSYLKRTVRYVFMALGVSLIISIMI